MISLPFFTNINFALKQSSLKLYQVFALLSLELGRIKQIFALIQSGYSHYCLHISPIVDLHNSEVFENRQNLFHFHTF